MCLWLEGSRVNPFDNYLSKGPEFAKLYTATSISDKDSRQIVWAYEPVNKREIARRIRDFVCHTAEADNAGDSSGVRQNNEESAMELPQNFILHGPPGTSKTHAAIILAKKIVTGNIPPDIAEFLYKLKNEELELENETPELEEDDRWAIVQFHPSLTYEDFVRGIRAEVSTPRGSLQKYDSTNAADFIDEPAEPKVESPPMPNQEPGPIRYQVEDMVFAKFCKRARSKSGHRYVLILDEINRANLPAVFGELIYALEHRDKEVQTAYGPLTVPSNLYIIGTMNTADRSIGHMDYAIRRRFSFFEMLPNPDQILPNPDEHALKMLTFANVLKLFVKGDVDANTDWSERANTLSLDFEPADVAIGHTFFLNDDWKAKFKYQVLPILVEYLKDGVLEPEQAIEPARVNADPNVEKPKCSEIRKIYGSSAEFVWNDVRPQPK